MSFFKDFHSESKIFVVVAALAALVVVGAILLLRGSTPTTVEQPIVQEEPIDNQQLTIDTLGWQTYRSEEFGFEFQYPSTWAHTSEYGDKIRIAIQVSNFRHSNNFECDVGYIGLEIQAFPIEGTFDAFVESLRKELTNPGDFIEEMNVDGHKAIKIQESGPTARPGCADFGYVLEQAPSRLILIAGQSNRKADEHYLDQIVSTFRFVE